jgi:hypothetical protein
MFEVIDQEKRALLGEFETREEAEAFRAELIAGDPETEDLLIVYVDGRASRTVMPTALDNGQRSPRRLFAALVRRLVLRFGVTRPRGAS